jgi:nucleoside-diphosphate-sugar epimerase
MKILLTGPCGRVGVFAFERLLEKGYQVRGFDIKDFMSNCAQISKRDV